MDLEKSSFLDFFSYLLPNLLYHKDKMVSVSSMEQTNPGKQLTNSSDDFTNLFPLIFLSLIEKENKLLIDPNRVFFLSLPVENEIIIIG